MKIRGPESSVEDGSVTYQYHIDEPSLPTTLWFTIDDNYKELLSMRLDGALAALLVPAMARGEDIYLEGTVSERLYFSLQHRYQEIVQTLLPSLSHIDIHATTVKPAHPRASGVAAGFSAGIDSFAVLNDHYYNDPPDGLQITHLLFNNVGSHGIRGEALFRERLERLRPVTERIGLPLVAINSNLDAFYPDFSFQETHTIRNTAVSLILQGGIGRFLYGSTCDYTKTHIEPTYDMAYSDPVSLPLLSTEGLDAMAVGSEYTRVEKTLHVADIEESHRSLDICVDGETAGNCSKCWKCRRTMLTLEIAGLLNRYNDVFDVDAYRWGRRRYIAKVLASRDPLLQEIVEFAKREEYEFPLSSKLASTVYNPVESAFETGIAGSQIIRQRANQFRSSLTSN